MKKKTIGTLLALMTTISFTACGTKNAMVTEAVAMENDITIEETTGLIVEDAPEIELETEESLTRIFGDFVIYNEAQGESVEIPLKDFYPIEGEYLLNSTLPLYYTGGKTAGYALGGATIKVQDGNTEWLRFLNPEKRTEEYFTVDFLLVKVDELREVTDIEVVTTEKTEPTTELIASAEPETSEVVASQPAPSKPKTETPVTSEPVVVEPSTTEPVAVEPEPVAVESNKYTPEEAVAVYRSIMEANGISWDPSIKEFASWGTGWIYLEKGQPEWSANSSVESHKMGDGDGVLWDRYYIEITGSDNEAVYITKWHS